MEQPQLRLRGTERVDGPEKKSFSACLVLMDRPTYIWIKRSMPAALLSTVCIRGLVVVKSVPLALCDLGV